VTKILADEKFLPIIFIIFRITNKIKPNIFVRTHTNTIVKESLLFPLTSQPLPQSLFRKLRTHSVKAHMGQLTLMTVQVHFLIN